MKNHSLDIFSKLISPSIKVVSFDIFDTVLFRPFLKPTDLFVFLDKYFHKNIKKSGHINFYSVRMQSEQELIAQIGVEHISFDAIYDKIQTRLKLTPEHRNEIKEYELSLETNFAFPNKEICRIVDFAKECSKKVIFTSDMYLSSDMINTMLKKAGIFADAVYVSSDVGKRKDSGELFEYILSSESISPDEMIHIGDNEQSDFLIPLSKGIISFHYKSEHQREKSQIITNGDTSFFLGFLINETTKLVSGHNRKFTNLYDFGYYCLGPFVLSLVLKILHTKKIQENYDAIYFSSRDGYIPFKVYEYICAHTGFGRKGNYIYCGRRALCIAEYNNDAVHFITDIYNDITKKNKNYTVEKLFDSLKLTSFYNSNNNNIEGCITDVDSVNNELKKRKVNTKEYFSYNFQNDSRVVIFDCGYSGSVSDNLIKLTGKSVDKVYIWETDVNKKKDRRNKTKTFLLQGNVSSIDPFHLIFEEVFSPPEPSCIGYQKQENNFLPVFDSSEKFSEKTINSLAEIHKGIMNYVERFCDSFAQYIVDITSVDCKAVFEYSMAHLFDPKDQSINLLSGIIFEDKHFESDLKQSLLDKLCNKNYKNVFKGNIFIDPLNLRNIPHVRNNVKLKIGIHIHLYHVDLYMDFIERLISFPYPFDLYITTTNPTSKNMLLSVFSGAVIPMLSKAAVIITPNRGRDVAPWIIEMQAIHWQYNIFAHFHSKKTEYSAESCRGYFLENLLGRDAVIDIMELFCNDCSLGLVYPPMFEGIYNVLLLFARDHPYHEDALIRDFCQRIKVPPIENINEIIFSAGTMFWYRPESLRRLFIDDISYADFPNEPIGADHTLAHAIERLPSYIASLADYHTKLYLANSTLVNCFYERMYYSKLYNQEKAFLDSRTYYYAKKIGHYVKKFIPEGSRRFNILLFILKSIKKHIRTMGI